MVQVFYTEGMLLIQHDISVPDRVDWSQLARSTRLQGCNLEWNVYPCV
jgi:hypothetical protein